VHDDGDDALKKAAQGYAARFMGESRTPEGIRYWDNLLTPIIDGSGLVRVILCVSRDVTEKTRTDRELQNALEREQLLSQEVQHRIKNAFAVMSGLIFISEREAASAGAPETTTSILREKVNALARASDVAFSPTVIRNVTTDSVEAAPVIVSVLRPYGDQCRISGDAITIAFKNMTTVALFLHELATNSVKYGSLCSANGHVAVSWALIADGFRLTWREVGGPPVGALPKREGFGSEMLDRIVQSAGGMIDRRWLSEGLVAELHLPTTTGSA